jgi:hypothetical protein
MKKTNWLSVLTWGGLMLFNILFWLFMTLNGCFIQALVSYLVIGVLFIILMFKELK